MHVGQLQNRFIRYHTTYLSNGLLYHMKSIVHTTKNTKRIPITVLLNTTQHNDKPETQDQITKYGQIPSCSWCKRTICTQFQWPNQGTRLQNAAAHRRGNRHQTQLHSFRCGRCLGQVDVYLNHIHRTQAPGFGARLCNIQRLTVVQSSTDNRSRRRCNLFEQRWKQLGWSGGSNINIDMRLAVNFQRPPGIPTKPDPSTSGFRTQEAGIAPSATRCEVSGEWSGGRAAPQEPLGRRTSTHCA